MESVLIVDDEPGVRRIMCLTMKDAGHHAIEAASADDALRLARAERPSVVLMDHRLSNHGPTGLDVLRSILRERPHVLTFMITGHGDEALAFACGDAKLTGYIKKPFQPKALANVVDRAAADRDANAAAAGGISPELEADLVTFADRERSAHLKLDTLLHVIATPRTPVAIFLSCAAALPLIAPHVEDAAVSLQFNELARRIDRLVALIQRPREAVVRSALRRLYLAARERLALTLDDLAEHAHLSSTQLGRKIQDATGFDKSALSQAYRLQRAVPDIVNGAEPIEQVAVLSGYNDTRTLRRDFDEVFSMSPTELRAWAQRCRNSRH